MGTDREWKQWGYKDPYFGVYTDQRFRNENLTDESRHAFFESGQLYLSDILDFCQRHIEPGPTFQRSLDFGCGTGRVLVPLATISDQAVGMDVSPGMLAEAKVNCDAFGLDNVTLLSSDDRLGNLEGEFDLIHSFIVLQHIAPARGLRLLERLVARLATGGVLIAHVTYGKRKFASSGGYPHYFQDKLRAICRAVFSPAPKLFRRIAGQSDPLMQMNLYPLNPVFFLLQSAGMGEVHVRYTDHDGVMGVIFVAKKDDTGKNESG